MSARELEVAVREASAVGASLRQIAAVVGRNHEWVRGVLRRGMPYETRRSGSAPGRRSNAPLG